jgi:dTMP kinase
MLINISGLEGTGKSTASAAVKEFLKGRDIPLTTTREPGGTPIAEMLRDILKHTESKELFDPMTELLLFYAARNQLFKNVITPALDAGHVVLSDRSYYCSYAYQIHGHNTIPESDFWTCHNLVMNNAPAYDLIVYLYTETVEEGLERARGRGELDRIEKNHVEFFKRAKKGYELAFEGKSNVLSINTTVHDEASVKDLVIKRLMREINVRA